MKSRVLTMSLVVALLAALIGGATMAYFTAGGAIEQDFKAGTLAINVGEQDIKVGEYKNMAPGDTIEGSFTVENIGSLELCFDVEAITEEVAASENKFLFGGETPAVVTIGDYNGRLAREESVEIEFEVHLPWEADDWYQAAEGILYFVINAKQCEGSDPTPEYPFTVEWFRAKEESVTIETGSMGPITLPVGRGKLTFTINTDLPTIECAINLQVSRPKDAVTRQFNDIYANQEGSVAIFEVPDVPNFYDEEWVVHSFILTIAGDAYELTKDDVIWRD